MGLRSVGVLVLGIVVLVMASACLNQPTRTNTPTSPSTSSLTTSHRERGDVNPPEILDFNWTPTKVVWDKIYDIKITFRVIDDESRIKRVVLKFVPVGYEYFITKYGMRPEDYPKVFPPEKERVYELKPVDGVFDELKEEFSVEIKNITGGREYRMIITAEDDAGNTQKFEYKTPYIRQYENLGRRLYEKGIIVGTPYYVWYRNDLSNWHDYGHKYTPLMGTYKSNDPIVISKHIDWATGYGINLFLVSWSGYEEGDLKFFDENLQLMFNISISQDIYIAILYESVGRLISRPPPVYISLDDERNVEILTSDLRYLAKMYFSKQNYLRIEGKPIVYLYESKGYTGNLENAIRRVRETITNEYGTDIFLISDHAHPLADMDDPVWIDRLKQFDGVTVWLGGYLPDGKYVGGSYTKQLKINYSKWYNLTSKLGILLIPFGTPEFDNRLSWGSPNSIPILRDKNSSKQNLQTLLEYSSELPDSHKMIFWGTFNDFFESTTLEPAQQYEFSSLDGLREVLEEYLENITSPEPQVLDFNWTPTKVAWDKVYDLNVSFKLSYPPDEISSVKLIFKPENYSYFITEYGMRREDYYKVFPNDSRVYELTPVDGVLDEPLEEFEVNITNITGGAEYWILIQIQTKNGRTVEYKRKTPYIRQYENFGRQLYEKGILVGATYYLWYRREYGRSNWDDGHLLTPLLGEYLSNDSTVISKTIDWMTGYGINTVILSYDPNFMDKIELFMKNPLVKEIKVSFMYECPGRLQEDLREWFPLNEHNLNIMSEDIIRFFEIAEKNGADLLKIDNKYVFQIYGAATFSGNVSAGMSSLRNIIESRVGVDVYIIGDHLILTIEPAMSEIVVRNSLYFDGISSWAAGYLNDGNYGSSYEEYLDVGYRKWRIFCDKNKIGLHPAIIPSFDGRWVSWGNPNEVPVERSPKKFRERLEIAYKYATEPKFLIINTYNDFFENTQIEPTTEEGMLYLEVLKDFLETVSTYR